MWNKSRYALFTINAIRTGDTTYGFNANAGGFLDELARHMQAGGLFAFTLIDDGGTDTFDYSGATQDSRVDLTPRITLTAQAGATIDAADFIFADANPSLAIDDVTVEESGTARFVLLVQQVAQARRYCIHGFWRGCNYPQSSGIVPPRARSNLK